MARKNLGGFLQRGETNFAVILPVAFFQSTYRDLTLPLCAHATNGFTNLADPGQLVDVEELGSHDSGVLADVEVVSRALSGAFLNPGREGRPGRRRPMPGGENHRQLAHLPATFPEVIDAFPEGVAQARR